MGEYNASAIDTIPSTIEDFEVAGKTTDAAGAQDETEWQNPKFSQYFGYYRTIPELKRAIDMKAMWTVGKGYTADSRTTTILDKVEGWGNDTFNTILWNMLVIAQVNGDAFAEIISNEGGQLINLKPLDPNSIKIIVNRKGIIKRYEQINKLPDKGSVIIKFKPQDIFHLTIDRVADEIHGVSIIEACQWVIDALNEAEVDQRKLMHLNVAPIKLWHLDSDDDKKKADVRRAIQESKKDFTDILVPLDVVKTEILATPANSTLNPLPWIQYLKSLFFQIVGVSEITVGGAPTGTESSSKISFLSSEQSIKSGQRYIKEQIWDQLAQRVEFEHTASLEKPLQEDEAKDGPQGQTNFQPNETTAGVGR